MARSSKKGPFVANHLIWEVANLNIQREKKLVVTWAYASAIIPIMIDHTIIVRNGREHLPIYVINHMVGHKLSESVPLKILGDIQKMIKDLINDLKTYYKLCKIRKNQKLERVLGKNIRMPATKIQRILDQIRGCLYGEALVLPKSMTYKTCYLVSQLIVFATANANTNFGLNKSSLFISEA